MDLPVALNAGPRGARSASDYKIMSDGEMLEIIETLRQGERGS
jgi:hypothetical protein